MSKTQWNESVDVLLRDLDAAQSPRVGPEGSERARTVFARIVATREAAPAPAPVSGGAGGQRDGRTSGRQSVARRAVTVGAVAAALAVGSVVAPNFFGASTALAWSAEPQSLTAEQVEEAEAACDASIRESQEHAAGLDLPAEQRPVVTELRPVITELRGSLVLVYATDSKPAPSTVTCYVRDGEVVASGGSAATASSEPLPALAADSLHGDLGAVYSTSGGSIRGVTGDVGSDVVAVVLDSVAKGPVTATVTGGHFAAWWPDAPTTEAKENAAAAPEITGATVTLRDGTTRQVSVEELSGRTTEELARPDTGGSSS
ncbi:hypothetical protein [Intrasporangium sp. DVR]|uniref:hypothetical protein n=1 Tax=Intrasporangium sp. DVR TaxID=3127867 RepID=UPI00313A67FB